MADIMIKCPHQDCSGMMHIAPGSETARMLLCDVCGEYYYRVFGVMCVRCCVPNDVDQADALLEAPLGQKFEPSGEIKKILDRSKARWRELGIHSPFTELP